METKDLRILSLESFDKTKEAWSQQVGEELFISKYEDLFRSIGTEIFVNRNTIGSDHRADYYGYYEDSSEVAIAILSITKTQARKLTKVLNIHLAPKKADELTEEDIIQIAIIYRSLISEFFALSEKSEGEVKVYARSDFELKTFNRVADLFREYKPEIRVFVQAGWLIIDLNKPAKR